MSNEAPEIQETEQKSIGGARPGAGAPKGNGNRRTHGLRSLQKAWSQLGNRVIDGRSPAAVALRPWRANVIDDLGGKEAISTQQEALIDLACKSKLLLDSVDTWLMAQPSLASECPQARASPGRAPTSSTSRWPRPVSWATRP